MIPSDFGFVRFARLTRVSWAFLASSNCLLILIVGENDDEIWFGRLSNTRGKKEGGQNREESDWEIQHVLTCHMESLS